MKKYIKGVTYSTIKQKCKCQVSEIVVADELGEDCLAYEEIDKLKGVCENCGERYLVGIVFSNDVKY